MFWGEMEGGGGEINIIIFFVLGGVKEKVMGVVYSLKTLKWHTFLNIWLQTCLQTRLQTRPPELI